jgi:methyl-accepting chemotaxis protein
MLIAKVEHRNWVAQLIRALKDEMPPPRKFLDDQYSCNFGVWYHGRGRSRYQHLPGFLQIDAPHRRVHEIAEEIDGVWRGGKQRDMNAGLIDELLVQRDAVLEALGRLELEVAHSL